MSSEYNSKLIANLYKEANQSTIEEILHEMADIGDPIFIYPIFDIWQQHTTAYNSHYYISALDGLNSPEVLKVALRIFDLSPTLKDKLWVYQIFTKYQYIDPKFVEFAYQVIKDFVDGKLTYTFSDFDLASLLDYLKLAGQIDRVSTLLRLIILNDAQLKDIRRMALYYLLRIDPKREIHSLIEEFQYFNTESLAGIIAKEIIKWSGGEVPQLIELLKVKGKGRSKDIIDDYYKDKQQKGKQETEKQAQKYSNEEAIIQIGNIIKQINTQASINKNIGFQLFGGGTQLIEQLETVQNIDQLKSKCIALREFFEDVSEKTSQHGLPVDICKKVLNIQDEVLFNKPLNRLVLFLHSKGIEVDEKLYGLRKINQIANLMMHPREEARLILILKEMKMYELYRDQKWDELHKSILIAYDQALKTMLDIIEK